MWHTGGTHVMKGGEGGLACLADVLSRINAGLEGEHILLEKISEVGQVVQNIPLFGMGGRVGEGGVQTDTRNIKITKGKSSFSWFIFTSKMPSKQPIRERKLLMVRIPLECITPIKCQGIYMCRYRPNGIKAGYPL